MTSRAIIDTYSFEDQTVFVRVDFNVPLDEKFRITDDTRMRAALPTLNRILKDNGRVIIASHMGRPKAVEEKYSLEHIRPHLEELLGRDVKFAASAVGDATKQMAHSLKKGEVLLLENLRFFEEEEGKPRNLSTEVTEEEKKQAKAILKERQLLFAKQLADLADCYVNDAFGTAHRAHASTAVMAQYFDAQHKMFGLLMEKEVQAVDRILNQIERPFTAIMGGSKVSSKIEIIENLLGKVDYLVLTGGMTYTFSKAFGGKIGNSICEDDKLDLALEIVEEAKQKGVTLVLSEDAKIADAFDNNANVGYADNNNIPDGWQGMDIGPKTTERIKEVIAQSKTILWNGPTGVFEFDNFSGGSKAVAEAIAQATQAGAYSLVGGGDSVACVNKFGLANRMSYVSTGGGALLEAIEGKTLPGVAAIES
ncbi:phosphoglycerate kinase [Porphyromonas crevioricanis]|uniref:Phosphoglycerate kinase n=1 Tax=Porphyromonas crevioricanis TaxID=393921 RepID=A0A0A2FSX3_9PORP|nr:phosphoglycerate kinase [Porphyromonas crevioricanis]KGN89928.1 phosphoglycerate kinase [Porphyromonas crevioricanis]KGN94113.1 phosphoglycerate kinase [Porphyromonas crevioricanis]GAD08201.1 phosphoglycerate kinase [Porphyromonas crevioricanis JCM 13913]SQH73920.1 Phosphoglycerate kinase [Porphyromonas crevioricanis]